MNKVSFVLKEDAKIARDLEQVLIQLPFVLFISVKAGKQDNPSLTVLVGIDYIVQAGKTIEAAVAGSIQAKLLDWGESLHERFTVTVTSCTGITRPTPQGEPAFVEPSYVSNVLGHTDGSPGV